MKPEARPLKEEEEASPEQFASATAVRKKVVYQVGSPAVAPHTLKIVTADANPVQLDAFVNLH